MSTTSSLLSPSPPSWRDSLSSPWAPSPSSNGGTATPSPPTDGGDNAARRGTAKAIIAQGLSKSFGDTSAVHELDLEVPPGELPAIEPRVLLLDEPFGALDAKVRRDLRGWLHENHDRTGHTTLFVTHDQEEALELADSVAVFNRGRIEQVGTPDQILDRPATAFAAGFVGEAVCPPVDAAGCWMSIGRHAVRTSTENLSGPAELFVRPGDLAVARDRREAIPARVTAVHRSGSVRRAELALAEGLPTVEIELPAEGAVRKGGQLPVVLTTVRLFSPRSTA
jgi:ABC-type sulfate/molybdate transport systems ATPase subunit